MLIDADGIIRGEIRERGPMTFARFMELALYAPGVGYYEREGGQTGRDGDFYTSVSVGPVLGFLLASWMARVGDGFETIDWVEAAAHDGRLAADVLEALVRFYPRTAERVRYMILEPSALRRSVQQRTLEPWADRVTWRAGWADVTAPVRGVVFSNELLDAMPVHRLGWDAKHKMWFEWGVRAEGDGFGWARLELHDEISRTAPFASNDLTTVLPDGFTIEICPAAEAWWRDAATILGRGKLLTLDYGLTHEEFFAPHRASGTLRGYHRHRHTDNVLDSPGEQDITAHVSFSRIRQVGERAGLRTEQFTSQTQFLTGIAAQTWRDTRLFGEWTPAMTRQFQTLTHPDHFGRAFKVLVQSK